MQRELEVVTCPNARFVPDFAQAAYLLCLYVCMLHARMHVVRAEVGAGGQRTFLLYEGKAVAGALAATVVLPPSCSLSTPRARGCFELLCSSIPQHVSPPSGLRYEGGWTSQIHAARGTDILKGAQEIMYRIFILCVCVCRSLVCVGRKMAATNPPADVMAYLAPNNVSIYDHLAQVLATVKVEGVTDAKANFSKISREVLESTMMWRDDAPPAKVDVAAQQASRDLFRSTKAAADQATATVAHRERELDTYVPDIMGEAVSFC